jgi:uncharacterized membrane protein YtjA (UPF0391 family)
MLSWAVFFLLVALIAAMFGFGGISSAAAGTAQILFFVFLALFAVMLVIGLMNRRRGPPA